MDTCCVVVVHAKAWHVEAAEPVTRRHEARDGCVLCARRVLCVCVEVRCSPTSIVVRLGHVYDSARR